jgi:hypothetical protein
VDDPHVFKGRDNEINRIISALEGGQKAVVVYGISRVGKTSLLRYLNKHVLPARNFIPVMVDLQGISERSEAGFWNHMMRCTFSALEKTPYALRKRKEQPRIGAEKATYENFRRWLEHAAAEFSGLRLVFLFDEINALEDVWENRIAAVQVVGQLKSLVEVVPAARCIFSVQEALFKRMFSPGKPLLLGALLRLGIDVRLDILDRSAAQRLIREPLGERLSFSPELEEKILHLSACHPFYLQNLLFNLVDRARQERRKQVEPADLEAVMPELLSSGAHLFEQFLREYRGRKRDLLSVVASLQEVRGRCISAPEAAQALKERGYDAPPHRALEELEMLCDWGAIARRVELGKPCYSIRVPLFQVWLTQNIPIGIIRAPARKGSL